MFENKYRTMRTHAFITEKSIKANSNMFNKPAYNNQNTLFLYICVVLVLAIFLFKIQIILPKYMQEWNIFVIFFKKRPEFNLIYKKNNQLRNLWKFCLVLFQQSFTTSTNLAFAHINHIMEHIIFSTPFF